MKRRKSDNAVQKCGDSHKSCLMETQEDASNGKTKRTGHLGDDAEGLTSELHTCICKKEDDCNEYDEWTLLESLRAEQTRNCTRDDIKKEVIGEDDVKEATSEFQTFTCEKEEDFCDDCEFEFGQRKSSGALLNSPRQDAIAINTNPDSSIPHEHENISMNTADDRRSSPEFSDPTDEQEALFDEAFLLSGENDMGNCENHEIAAFSKDTGNSIARTMLDEHDGCFSTGMNRDQNDKLIKQERNHQGNKHYGFSSKNEDYHGSTSDKNKSSKVSVHTFLESESTDPVYLGSLQVEPVPLPAGCGYLWKVIASESKGAESKERDEQRTCTERKSSGTSQDANTISIIPDESSSLGDVNIFMETESETGDNNKSDHDSSLDQEALFKEAFSLSGESDLENCENDLITDFSKDSSSPIDRPVFDENNGYTSDRNIHHNAELMTQERNHQGNKLLGFRGNIEDCSEGLTSHEKKSSTGKANTVAESKSTNPVYFGSLQVEAVPIPPGCGFLWKVITSENIGEKPFKCDKCDYSCARPSYLEEHIKTTHTYKYEYSREDHEKFTYPTKNLPAFSTAHYSKSTYPFYATQTNMSSQHENIPMVIEYGAAAEKITSVDHSLNEHGNLERKIEPQNRKIIHNEERPFKCDQCGNQYKRLRELKNHTMSHTGERPFKCDNCDYSCKRQSILKCHQMTHTGEKPFKCDQCGNQYKTRCELKIHIMSHTGERPFKCDLCEFSTIRYSTLKYHKMAHTGERPIKCDQCSYSCVRRSNLKLHKMTHTGERPFKCDQCSYSCIRRCNLTLHKMIHIDEKQIYSCDHCNYTATTYVRWKCHSRIHYEQKPQQGIT